MPTGFLLNGGLPYLAELGEDDIIEFDDNKPYFNGSFIQNNNINGGLPYLQITQDLGLIDRMSEPYPDSLFKTESTYNDGLPYLNKDPYRRYVTTISRYFVQNRLRIQ